MAPLKNKQKNPGNEWCIHDRLHFLSRQGPPADIKKEKDWGQCQDTTYHSSCSRS